MKSTTLLSLTVSALLLAIAIYEGVFIRDIAKANAELKGAVDSLDRRAEKVTEILSTLNDVIREHKKQHDQLRDSVIGTTVRIENQLVDVRATLSFLKQSSDHRIEHLGAEIDLVASLLADLQAALPTQRWRVQPGIPGLDVTVPIFATKLPPEPAAPPPSNKPLSTSKR